jgi:hypothetical protein
MFVGEYGKRLILEVGYDVSAATALGIEITKPDGSTVSYVDADGVTAGNVDTIVEDEKGRQYSLTAYQYIYRDWESGDLGQAGAWKARAIYTDGGKSLRSKWVCFSVSP